jgi:predicted DNA-binding ribbon-helix-helix protein
VPEALRENAGGKTDVVVRTSTAEPAAFTRRLGNDLARGDGHTGERRIAPPAGLVTKLLGGGMKSLVVKRSIVIDGHKTSVSLEEAFWKGLKEIASNRDASLSQLVGSIDADRLQGNLSSAIRLFVLDHYRTMIGSGAAAHGSGAKVAAHVVPTP